MQRQKNNTGCQVTGVDDAIPAAGISLDPISDQIVNSGDLVNMTFTSPNATHVLWADPSAFNNPSIGIMGSIGFNTLMFTAVNNGTSPLVSTIRVVALNGNCVGQSRLFTITVNPSSNTRLAKNSLAFAATKLGTNDVQVNWEITYEFELESIEIEKFQHDGEWAKIGEATSLNSSFVDRGAMSNVTKYRLKLVHADGRIVWSREVEVNFDASNQAFTVYPNPSNGSFSLLAASELEGEWGYRLIDPLGRTVKIGKITELETAFDIRKLPSGYYSLLVSNPQGKSHAYSLVKE